MLVNRTRDRERHLGAGGSRRCRRILPRAVLLACACATGCAGMQFDVVGLDRRPDADVDLEIVGPTAAADPSGCLQRRFVDEPTTPAAIDVRCTPYVSH